MLRVVRDSSGVWDCLNEPEDRAKGDETIFVYAAVNAPVFACTRGVRGHRSRRTCLSYRYLPDQPPESIVRDNEKWAAWCEENKARLLAVIENLKLIREETQ